MIVPTRYRLLRLYLLVYISAWFTGGCESIREIGGCVEEQNDVEEYEDDHHYGHRCHHFHIDALRLASVITPNATHLIHTVYFGGSPADDLNKLTHGNKGGSGKEAGAGNEPAPPEAPKGTCRGTSDMLELFAFSLSPVLNIQALDFLGRNGRSA